MFADSLFYIVIVAVGLNEHLIKSIGHVEITIISEERKMNRQEWLNVFFLFSCDNSSLCGHSRN